MSTFLNAASLRVGDLLWGWVQPLPRDLAILLIAGLSTLAVLLLRRLLTDQALLRDIRADERTLRQRIKDAKRAGDQASLARYRSTHAAVLALKLSQELRVLPLAVLLILVTVTWGNARFAWLPVRSGEPVVLAFEAPRVHAGQIVHLVPQPGLSVDGSWLRQLDVQTEPLPHALAAWKIRIDSPPGDCLLHIRAGDRTLEHPIKVDIPPGTRARVRRHPDGFVTTLQLQRYQPFGLPVPWTVTYGVWCVVMYVAGRRLLGVV